MARGRMTIGLYNSYDSVRFREAHRRALARAGPVAVAFDANLATFGFPYGEAKIPGDIARWIATTTSIGDSGKYLVDLADAGRFGAFGFPRGGFPPQLGAVVITTNRPEEGKAADAARLAGLLRSGTSILLVFGLGPRGLDNSDVYPMGRYHWDVTGRGIPLETATAIGAAPAILAAILSG